MPAPVVEPTPASRELRLFVPLLAHEASYLAASARMESFAATSTSCNMPSLYIRATYLIVARTTDHVSPDPARRRRASCATASSRCIGTAGCSHASAIWREAFSGRSERNCTRRWRRDSRAEAGTSDRSQAGLDQAQHGVELRALDRDARAHTRRAGRAPAPARAGNGRRRAGSSPRRAGRRGAGGGAWRADGRAAGRAGIRPRKAGASAAAARIDRRADDDGVGLAPGEAGEQDFRRAFADLENELGIFARGSAREGAAADRAPRWE